MKSLKFYPVRMIRLIESDGFLEFQFTCLQKKFPHYHLTNLLEIIYHSEIIGDSVLTKKYLEI